MNNKLFAKLAVTNLKKNYRTYIPYILSCIGTIMMYYMMHAISINKGLDTMRGAMSLKMVLTLGTYIIAIFSALLLFYTNSFLIKRRKKEIGLYNILGMEKKHISRILSFETLYSAGISLVLGLIGGFILFKLMFLVLENILNFPIALKFSISVPSMVWTLILFSCIFLASLCFNLFQIHLSNPIELLNGGKVGEKEPKSKWILALTGLLCLSAGYYIALTTEKPLQALQLFFLAVILVIIGTYALFIAGSIAILKILRKNKNFYYKPNHFISISGMIYRMKQNAAGLANICILSTMVLVMLSTTGSMYFGLDDVMDTRFPKDFSAESWNADNQQIEKIKSMLEQEANRYHITMKDKLEYRSQSLYYDLTEDGNEDSINFMPLSEYNRLAGTSLSLGNNEALVYCMSGKIKDNQIHMGSYHYKIKERLQKFPIARSGSAYMVDVFYIILADQNDIVSVVNQINLDDKYSKPISNLSYRYLFDIKGKQQDMDAFGINARKNVIGLGSTTVYSKQESRESFYATYGGLFFLGIFLGILFLSATVLIIYYKQISEGFDDKERFQIMQKVGMSKKEIQHSILSQILGVFFLPLIMAVIHIAFAFKIITKLLFLLNLANLTLFFLCTVGTVVIFAVIYAVVYILTAKVYYKIVS